MSERPNPAWWPSDYVDEVMPHSRASPSDWIVIGPDAPMLAPPDYYDEEETPERVLRDGDIVGFTSCITHDVINMALTANGYVFDRPPPVGFGQCCCLNGWQVDTLDADVVSMIGRLLTLQSDGVGEGNEFDVAFVTWDHGADYRFVAATRTFEKVEAPAVRVQEADIGPPK